MRGGSRTEHLFHLSQVGRGRERKRTVEGVRSLDCELGTPSPQPSPAGEREEKGGSLTPAWAGPRVRLVDQLARLLRGRRQVIKLAFRIA
jgi:hypothetical protein